MTAAKILIAILGLAVLMVVHEAGHYLAARHYGMRVLKFSIGFGPTLWKHRPNGSSTTFQIALIPFLAYVQIAGMNPYEDNDPKDPESYVNASLWGRMVTIASAPLTNYLFASVLLFLGLLLGGREVVDYESMKVLVHPSGAAAQADMRNGDRIVAVNGEKVASWEQLKRAVGSHAGEPIDVLVDRDGQSLTKAVTPGAKGAKDEGKIMVEGISKIVPVGAIEAAKLSLVEPAFVVYGTVRGLARLALGKEKAEVSGPVGIVKETARQAERGPGWFFQFLGILSAYLAAFNLLPFPALDGGRLMFLGVEAIARRKPDPKVEARIHALGLIMLLGLIVFVSYFDITRR